MKKKIFGLCISLACCSVASATKYYVNDASTTGDVYCTAVGAAGNNGLSPSAPRLTLTSVLSTYAASFAAGDTIFVDAGTYSEIQLSSPLNGVVIKGAGIMKTLISPSGSDRYFMLINDNNTVLSDMKLSGYDNQTTSGVQALGIANGTTGVKILNVQVDGCKTTSTGGGYPIEVGSGVSVVFNGGGATCNTWDAGGGMHVAGSTSTVTIRNFQFIGNYQLAANGTALSVAGGTVNVLNTRFEYNTIGGDKSGVGIDMQGGVLNIYDSYFYNNKTNILSNNIGGALSVHAGTCHVVRSVFSTNVPQSATSGIYGAAIGETGGSLLVDSCRFTANSGARANDIYVSGGNALTRNCTFGSAANQIGIAGTGTFSISLCGTPSEYGAGIVHINTTAPSYTANPSLPDYLPVSCVAIPCTTPTITSTAPTGTICSGGTFSTALAATTNSAQTTYSWTSTAVAGISGHATTGSGNINETLTNGTGSPLTVTYSVTPNFNTSCAGPVVVYTVTVYPVATILASGSVMCSSSSATITPSGALTYTLNPGTLTGSSFTVTPSANTTYTVSGSSASGCPATQAVLTITVLTTPTLALSINQSTICSGNAVVFTPSGASTYTLNPGSLSGSSFTLTPGSTTTYTLNGTGSAGCVSANTPTATVVVNATPTVSLAASATTLCSGNSLVLTPSGAYTYTLNPGNLSSTSFTLVPSASTVYTLSGTSSSACVAANTATLSVTVNTTPTLALSVSSPSLCSGNSVVLNPSGASTYTLSPGNLSAASFTLTPLSTTQYTLSGQSAAGCPAWNTPTTTVTVYTTPTITPASAGSQTLCSGTTITLTASGATTYTWNPGGLTGNSINDTPISSTVYTVTGMNTPGNCVNTATITMTVNATPTVNIPTNTLDLCSGNPLILPAATGGTVISWTGPNSFTSAVSSPTVTNAITASDAGIYTVSLSQSYPGITCYSAAEQVTVSVVSSAVIAVANTSVCIGSSVVITPSGGTSYTLTPGGSAGQSFTLSPLSTSVYTVNGTAGTGCDGSSSFTLQVNPLPTVTAVPAATQVCSGFGTSLTASGTDTYAWDANAGNATSATVSVTPLSSTVYTVVGTNTLTGCSSPATVTVNVATTPTVSVVSSLAAVCAGQSATLTLSGATSYTVANPVQVATSTVQVTPSAPTTYTVLGLDGLCYSQPVTLFVDYIALPVLSVSDQTICAQSSATLTASGADTYTWMPGSQYNATVSVAPASTTVYTVAGTSTLTGCSSNETLVTLYVNPLPTLTVTANPGIVCTSGTVNLAVVSSAAGSTYTWSPGNGITGANQNQPLVSFPASGLNTGVYVYTVEATSPLACVSAPATVSLQVVALPNSSFSLSPLSLCQNATGVLSIDSPQSGVSYNWTLGSIPVSNTASVSIPSSLTGASGQYTVAVVAAIGSCTNASVSTLTVHALPQVAVSPDQVSECAGTTVVFTASSSDPSLSFVWTYSGQTLGNGNSWTISSVSASQAGLYVVTATDANGCKASAQAQLELKDCEVFIPEIFTPNGDGKNDVFEIKHIEDYPNNRLKIFNRWGNLIYEKPGYNNEFDGHANVKDAVGSDKLPVGTYYVILEFNDGKTKAYNGYVQLQY